MNDRELGTIGSVGIVSIIVAVLFVLALSSCAASPPKPPPIEVKCGSSNYEKCADKCAFQGKGAPFIIENATDVACYCRKSGDGT